MNDTTNDRETYVERWNSHVGDLERLKWNLHHEDHAEEYQRIDEIKAELREIIEDAADNYEDN